MHTHIAHLDRHSGTPTPQRRPRHDARLNGHDRGTLSPITRLSLAALTLILTGCGSDSTIPERQADFGESVRHTIALQTASPNTAGTGLEGNKASAALQVYQKDVAKPEAVDQSLTIIVNQ